MRRLCLALLCLLVAAPGHAQDASDIEQRTRDAVAVMIGEMAMEEVFAPSFIAAVPYAQLQALVDRFTKQYGALEGVQSVHATGPAGAATIALRFEKAIARGKVQLEPAHPHRIAGLLIQTFEPVNEAGLGIVEQFEQLPGATSLYLAKLDGSEVAFSHNAAQQFAIGSTFKLYVLAALSRSIAGGERNWSDVVELDRRSLSSGVLHAWPEKAPMTLHTLATLMISISDNTATDCLIDALGRDAVEAELVVSGHANPAATLPIVTTRELFVLKGGEAGILAQYAAADLAERRAILRSMEGVQADDAAIQSAFAAGPRHLDIEWFASRRDIAGVFGQLIEDPVTLDILAINRVLGEDTTSAFDYVGYKGGSEPGVLDFSWLLRDQAGEWWVFSMAWNDPQNVVDEALFLGLANAAIREFSSNLSSD